MAYQDKKTKAEDFKSSAYTLLLVGIVGLIALILLALGVFGVQLASPQKYFTYGVMGALFVIFIVVGVKSLKSAGQYSREAVVEDELTERIKAWASENISADSEKNEALFDDDTPDEMKYYKYFESIKSKVTQEFGELDAAYLDEICEELYADIFEDGKKGGDK